MVVWPPKDPDETVAYSIDWAGQLGVDTIASNTFVVSTGDATISKVVLSAQSLRAYIAGGTDATTTTFLNTITTGNGQTLERSFSLYVGDGESSYQTTSTTKRQLVEQMFTECALNGWEYDLTADEKDTALTRLDMLMWELKGRGMNLGYNFPTAIGAGSLDDELGCPDQAFFALAILGAERLCPTMGKTQSRESRIAMNNAMKALYNVDLGIMPMNYSRGTAVGSGNKPWATRYPFAIIP